MESERRQRVMIITDLIQPISYGNQKLCMLQDFVHEPEGTDIIEKRFHPLSYVPIACNYIDKITIQLVKDQQAPVTAKDVKTVVVLHFKRIK